MKQLYRTRMGRLFLIGGAAITLTITAYCFRPNENKPYPHLAVSRHSGETVYIDSLDSRVAMDENTNISPDSVSCFLIGWSDNLAIGDELSLLRREDYFQHRMRQDWVALSGGDSIHPIFLRHRPLLNRHLQQGAVAFLLPPGHRIDTLVYTGTEGAWGKQLFILKRE